MSQTGIIKYTNNGAGATTYVESTGNAAPIGGILNVIGATGITTVGSGNTVTVSGIVQKSKITLTAAQIRSLHATPIIIVPAQGPNTVIVPIACTGKFVYGGTNQFTGGVSSNITFGNIDTYAGIPLFNETPIVAAVSSFAVSMVNASYTLDNVPITVHNSGVQEFGGNAANDNTIIIELFYYVSTLT